MNYTWAVYLKEALETTALVEHVSKPMICSLLSLPVSIIRLLDVITLCNDCFDGILEGEE